ncbi:MAG: DUF3459 domain-containing protein [Lentisphaerae bacterium]|nr:DUF3459 domain-containing protein [Lentisphaerota bacterium]
MSTSWIPGAIIYQINLRSLAAREPRNAIEAAGERAASESPLAYVRRNLPVLKRLGTNVLYLMPPYPMGLTARKGIGSPYAIRDFRAVDPEYGTRAELAALVRRAHHLGLRVILDITPNHSSRDNVWTRQHPEFYFKDEHGSLRFDWDWSDTAKLNYGAPGLRRAMRDVLDYWLGFLGRPATARRRMPADGVDGFRFDMAHIISDLSFWNEALAWLKTKYAPRDLLFMAESYGLRNNLNLFARGMNAAYDDDLYKVCQYLYGVDAQGQTVVSLAPEAAGNGDFQNLLAGFRAGGIAGAVAEALRQYESVLPPDPRGPWLARYTDNHDEGRGLYRFGAGGVRAMMQLVFLTGHTVPFLLTGQEFGAVNRPPIHERLGVCDKGHRLITAAGSRSRDGIEFEGNLFARGTRARQDWYGFYRRLCALRTATPALTAGRFEPLEAGEVAQPDGRAVVAFSRTHGNERLVCAVNMGPEPRRLSRLDVFSGRRLYGELKDGLLPPFGAIVIRQKST